ncbi:MAG: hypothetical protein AAGN35_09470 [Bacteroidota bacterium]
MDKHNLDALLFDFVEGNLDAPTAAAVEQFIALHPEHVPDLLAWQKTVVREPAGTAIAYPRVDQLVRPKPPGFWMGLNGVSLGVIGGLLGLGLFLLLWWPGQGETALAEAPVRTETPTEIPQNPALSTTTRPPEAVTESRALVAPPEEAPPEEAVAPPSVESTSPPHLARRQASTADPIAIDPAPEQLPLDPPVATETSLPDADPPITVPPAPPSFAADPVPTVAPPSDTNVRAGPAPPPAAAPIVQREYPSQQHLVKPGKRRRKQKKIRPPRKRVRVVPLNSDAF